MTDKPNNSTSVTKAIVDAYKNGDCLISESLAIGFKPYGEQRNIRCLVFHFKAGEWIIDNLKEMKPSEILALFPDGNDLQIIPINSLTEWNPRPNQ